MKLAFIVLVFVVVLLAAALVMAKMPRNGKAKKGSFGPKPLATANEQKMYWRLVAAFPPPEFVVLTQVAFGAMLNAKGGASRYSFDKKIADFVVTNKGFKVLAAIELDDSSHKGKEDKDASRDAILVEAGYRVFRYTAIPEIEKLRGDVTPPPPPPPAALPNVTN